MGQARARRERILGEQPNCIYCGGHEPAQSIDHCPPTAIFDGARRPRGLEFGACDACHQGTRQIDLVAAWLSRIYPDPVTGEARAEARKHIRGLINNHPQLALSLNITNSPEVSYRGRPAHPIRIDSGSRLHTAMTAFAARFGMAMFFEERRQPVPEGAVVMGIWMSNSQLDRAEDLEALLQSLGGPRTLTMGKQHVIDQFRYWAGTPAEDPTRFFSFGAFREAFGVIAMIDTEPGDDDFPPDAYRPGFLKALTI